MNVLHIRDKNGNFIPVPTISGKDGKNAYQYAQDGGYTGTEAEFAAKLAAEVYSREETDAAIEEATKEDELEVIKNFVAEDTAALLIDRDNNGEPFELTYAYLSIACGGDVEAGSYKNGGINWGTATSMYHARLYNTGTWSYPGYKMSEGNYRQSRIKAECYFRNGVTYANGVCGDEGDVTTGRLGVFSGDYMREVSPEQALTRVNVSIVIPKNAVVTLYGIRKVNANA